MSKLRAAVSLLVLFLFPLVVVALVIGVFFAIVMVAFAVGSSALGRVLAQLIVVPLLIAIFAAIREARRARLQPVAGPQLLREEYPTLWATIVELARLAKTEPPRRVVLIPEVNAAVHQVGSERELLLGLPLLAGLSVSELRSVLAHELGHFAGGDTALSARTYGAKIFLRAARDNAGSLFRWFFALYYRIFVWVSAASNRDLEARADRYSAQAAGPQAAASALIKLVQIDIAWNHVVEQRVSLFDQAGARAPLAEAVSTLMAAESEGLQQAGTQILEQQRPRWDDTHPRTQDRVAAFAALPPATFATDDRPALTLLADGPSLAAAEGELLTEDWPLRSWDEVASAAARRMLPQRLNRLLQGLSSEGLISEPSPSALLSALQTDPQRIGAQLDAEHPAEAAAEVAVVLTQGTLATASGVRVVMDAADGLCLVDVDRQLIKTRELAESADLAERLRSFGADLDVVVEESAVEARPARPVVLGALTMTLNKKPRRQARDLLICSDGLLFVPVTMTRWEVATGGTTKHNQQRRVEESATQLAQLRQDPVNEWIPAEEIASARLQIIPSRLTITRVDGTKLAVPFTAYFEEIGLLAKDPMKALLGERFRRG
ncbi:Zn-dependent protease with chaperone function [Propionicimonas paludicola]|uniref:Zn-dependent protease with chaperone function n=1 Tax=Propionicimonas paludicola TaxID=185243 RepID=A0A2A9CW81_9ACTN|nr:M48 family metallopeptidase [Propionicimonas paludicola]PFG17890.1 Zn-dependent protease with chaperone function [Propionicimonas paludicola]